MLHHIPEAIGLLKKNGQFFVRASPYVRLGTIDARKRLPPHRLVIEPIVSKAFAMRIFGWDSTSDLGDEVLSLGSRKHSYIEVDLACEVVEGHEAFWNTGSWQRGGIILAADLSDDEMVSILRWCSGPSVWSSLAQVKKGSPASAIKFAQSVAQKGSMGFCFSASNGIEWMDVFPPRARLMRLFKIACERCRPFKKHAKRDPNRDEIIIDRPPYAKMV